MVMETVLKRRAYKKAYAKSLGFNQLAHANRVLMKKLVFHYAQTLGLTNCYRCGKPLTLEDFTIDHIIRWRNKPNAKELFFDISNIKFSHFICNSSTDRKEWKHGHSGYVRGCRCTMCLEGHRLRLRKIRSK